MESRALGEGFCIRCARAVTCSHFYGFSGSLFGRSLISVFALSNAQKAIRSHALSRMSLSDSSRHTASALSLFPPSHTPSPSLGGLLGRRAVHLQGFMVFSLSGQSLVRLDTILVPSSTRSSGSPCGTKYRAADADAPPDSTVKRSLNIANDGGMSLPSVKFRSCGLWIVSSILPP